MTLCANVGIVFPQLDELQTLTGRNEINEICAI